MTSTHADSATAWTRPVRGTTTVLQPQRGWQPLELAKLWRYRDLLWFLGLRDIQVRYKQTALGAAWAVIQPLVTMVVLNVLFGKLMGLGAKTGATPYPVFLYAGLLPWTFFASTVTASSNSLVMNANMLRKVYFPRLIVPLASVGAPLVDYAVSFVVLLCMIAGYGALSGFGDTIYHVGVTWSMVLVPLLVGTTIVAALGVSLILASLSVRYRDFRYVVPFLVQIWFFLTPVIYPVSIVPADYQWLLALNPMSGTLEAFRGAVLGTTIDYAAWGISAAVAAGLLIVGLVQFARMERTFADIV